MRPNPVEAIGAGWEDIFPDNGESRVYARVFKDNLTFRFLFTPDDACTPTNLVNRIVTAYHGMEVDDADWTFADMDDIRFAIWATIARILPACSRHPEIGDPDVVLLVRPSRLRQSMEVLPAQSVAEDLQHEDISWEIYHDPDYHHYFRILKDSGEELMRHLPLDKKLVESRSLRREKWLGGRGSTLRVTLNAADDLIASSTYVYKGMDFGVYLFAHDDTDEDARLLSKMWVNEIKTLQKLPPHPHIPRPPSIFVTTPPPHLSSERPALYGYLTQYLPGGDLQSRVDRARNSSAYDISLITKAKWCYQLTSAVAHAHRHGEYHMDIKLSNILIQSDDDILLIDREQEDAPALTLAPEADGTFDVHQQADVLIYTKYSGPPRKNFNSMSNRSWNAWNVFPIWQKEWPVALELAEVFSLGRTMWLLFEMPDEVVWERCEHPNDIEPDWSDRAEAVPREWKETVRRCMDSDPNARPRLSELEAYWHKAWQGSEEDMVDSGVLEVAGEE